MKKILTLIFILTIAFGNKNAQAQTVTISKIKFDYDAAGNRIKRYPSSTSSERHAQPSNQPEDDKNNKENKEPSVDLTKANADVYPNPAKEFVIVNFKRGEEKAEAKLLMYDMQGKSVGELKLENGINTITVNQLKPANYLFRVVCGNYNEDWQVVKQN